LSIFNFILFTATVEAQDREDISEANFTVALDTRKGSSQESKDGEYVAPADTDLHL
jgi:uncharacterized protein with FMN-binding domain